MKSNLLTKLFLSFFFLQMSVAAFAQFDFAITAPANLAGSKVYTTSSWLDVDTMSNQICKPVIIGFATAGANTLDSLGGTALTNAAAVSGNIVLLYRGTYNFTVKLQNAVDAGAVAMIIVQRDATAPLASFGAPATSAIIPSIMISKADGDALYAAIKAGTPVSACIGKTTISNNLGFMNGASAARNWATPKHILLNDTDPSLVLGGEYTNYGLVTQPNSKVAYSLEYIAAGGAATSITTGVTTGIDCTPRSAGPNTPGDSLRQVSLYDLVNPAITGKYKMSATLSSDLVDAIPFNNTGSREFIYTANKISKVPIDAAGIPIAPDVVSAGSNAGYEIGPLFYIPKAVNQYGASKATDVVFSLTAAATAPTTTARNLTIPVTLFKWVDGSGISPTPIDNRIQANELEEVGLKEITTPANYVYGSPITVTLDDSNTGSAGVELEDDTFYWLDINVATNGSAAVPNSSVFMGANRSIDYNDAIGAFSTDSDPAVQRLTPWATIVKVVGDARYYMAGFGTETNVAVAMTIEAATATTKLNSIDNKVVVYPNPTSGAFNVDLTQLKSNANVQIINTLGEVVAERSNQTGIANFDMTAYASGMYMVRVMNAEGQSVKRVSLTK